jgi:hypothetical protein
MRRRLLAAAFAGALAAGVAACGNGNGNDDEGPPEQAAGDNTAEVCMEAEAVQIQHLQQLDQDLAALEMQELPEEELEEAAVEANQQALIGWSDGVAEQAEQAEDPQLSGALTDLSEALADVVPEITLEALQTGELPGVEEVAERNQAVYEICEPAMPEQPGAPGGQDGP